MPIVTDLRENRGFIEIDLNGVTTARVRKAHFAQCPVSPGDNIDLAAWLDRMAAVQFADAYEAALTSLGACDRSTWEMAVSLRRRGYVEPAVKAVLARLTESGLIDDNRYALRMCELESSKPVGVYAFRRKLKAKGIADEDAEEALSAFDDEQQQAAALEAARRLFKKYEALPSREARAKLSQALARRGFGWDAIQSAVDQLLD